MTELWSLIQLDDANLNAGSCQCKTVSKNLFYTIVQNINTSVWYLYVTQDGVLTKKTITLLDASDNLNAGRGDTIQPFGAPGTFWANAAGVVVLPVVYSTNTIKVYVSTDYGTTFQAKTIKTGTEVYTEHEIRVGRGTTLWSFSTTADSVILYTSSDLGQTWNYVSTTTITAAALCRIVYTIDKVTGTQYIVYTDVSLQGSAYHSISYIQVSTDNGATFATATIVLDIPDSAYAWAGMVNADNGVILIYYVDITVNGVEYNPYIMRSTNNGATWTGITAFPYLDGYVDAIGLSGGLRGACGGGYFFYTKAEWIKDQGTSSNLIFAYSADAGLTWHTVLSPVDGGKPNVTTHTQYTRSTDGEIVATSYPIAGFCCRASIDFVDDPTVFFPMMMDSSDGFLQQVWSNKSEVFVADEGMVPESGMPPIGDTSDKCTLVYISDLMEGRHGWFYDKYTPGILIHYGEEGSNVHAILCGGGDGNLYQLTGDDDAGAAVDCHVITESRDQGDTRYNKLYGDVMLDCNTEGVLAFATPRFNNDTIAPAATHINTTSRSQVPVPVGTEWQTARNISLDLEWGMWGTRSYFYIWEPRYTEEGGKVYAYSWETCFLTHELPGYFYHGYLYLVHISNADLTFTITDESGVVAATLTIPSSGGLHNKTFVRLPVIKGKMFKYRLACATEFRVEGQESELLVKPWGQGGPWKRERIFQDTPRGEAA